MLELGLPVEEKVIDVYTADYMDKTNPLRQLPTLELEDGRGIYDSRVICRYFDGISGMVPTGMEDVSKYPVLVKGLIDLGYSDADIRKIMGLNLLRVLRQTEEVAKQK